MVGETRPRARAVVKIGNFLLRKSLLLSCATWKLRRILLSPPGTMIHFGKSERDL